MVKEWLSKFKRALGWVRDFLDEKALRTVNSAPLSRLHRFAHFWLMVGKSFARNRCPVHASALAYTTLLALIPMLFVVISVSSSILKQEGGERINHFVDKLVVSLTPPSLAATNAPPASASPAGAGNSAAMDALNNSANFETNRPPALGSAETAAAPDAKAVVDRQQIVKWINDFINNIQTAKLGVTGAVVLVFVAISMLSRIEETFNDIWGVTRGRGWVARVIQYWAVISLGPVLLVVVLGLSNSPYLQSLRDLQHALPLVSRLLFQLLPVVLLCLAFAFFYRLMPNTKVRWKAALVGGLVGGVLWHLNNYFSVLYVSRWVTYSKIYGSLYVVPVFMIGLYLSWLILLFGAQVAYAYQNRTAYLEEKQALNINQRGREFIALRLMECIGQRFQRGQPPATVLEIADSLAAPLSVIHQLTQTLLVTRLVVEVAGLEPAYAPARPLESISCHDILLALRAGQGQELATRDDPARTEVYGEFERIMEAEKIAAAAVTVRAMVDRTEKWATLAGPPINAVTDRKPD